MLPDNKKIDEIFETLVHLTDKRTSQGSAGCMLLQRGFQRLEIVDQRDGPPQGHVIFHIDTERQRLTPLKGKKELEAYYRNYRPKQDDEEDTGYKSKKGDLDA